VDHPLFPDRPSAPSSTGRSYSAGASTERIASGLQGPIRLWTSVSRQRHFTVFQRALHGGEI
ncbi:uncharacterized protein METZ01_LOCUS285720, partial [marine metagenome]